MTRSVSTLAVLILAAVCASTYAQQPARDGTPAAKRVGTGIVAGVVSLGDNARTPVRRAVVTLTAADGSEKVAAISGDDGRFTIERVPAGQYTLSADKPAHLTIVYGARRPGRKGTPLIITDGQRIDELTLSLPRGAVLAGRVTLADGQPAPNVQIMAIPSGLATSGGSAAGGREFRTDDLGEFRMFGLAPDTYVVAALPSFGRAEIERMTDAAISGVLRQLQQPGMTGGAAIASPVTLAYAPTYFPGTPSVGDARPITVAAGAAREDLNFVVTTFPATTIHGRVVGPDGAPTQAVVLSIEAIGPAFPAGTTATAFIERPNRNGEFQVSGVSPGMYRLRARAGGVTVNANGAPGSTSPDAQTQYAVAEVSASGVNIDGVTLRLREGHRFTGTFTADGSVASPVWTGASVVVQPITAGPPDTLVGVLSPGVPTRQATVDTAGGFTVTGLEPFDYEIRVTLPAALTSAGWHVDSVRLGDRDLRDAPLTFADSSEGAEIRLTTAVTELTGRLTTESAMPATDYFIVAFPADRALWHPASPRVRVMRPAVDGTFSTKDLPAGAYRLAVVADVDDNEPRQPAFLESIYSASVAISLAAGRTTQQELRVGKRPD